MNETRGNSRTKQVKNPIFPENFTEREPLKERENHSLKDSEKTTGYIDKVKTSTKTKNFTYIVGFTHDEIKTTIQILKYYENEYLTYGEETHLGNLIKKLENKL